MLTFPSFNVSGAISPYTDPTTGKTIPGLVIRKNGFQFGTATLTYNKPISLGDILTFNSLTIGAGVTALVVPTALAFAYALAQARVPGRSLFGALYFGLKTEL
jgi:ABC-type glycerol-3-phosphate transport system permease component